MNKEITYQDAGVDPDKAATILSDFASYVEKRPRDPMLLSGIGPFASCYSLKTIVQDFEDPVLVTSCDGVGTKAKLALDWDHIGGLGQDLVAMNVNDVLCTGAKPFIFLDYYACGKLLEGQLSPILKSIHAACEACGASLVGGETAEMPGVYTEPDFDLAGFAIGVVERSEILGAQKVRPGDLLMGIESSGLHSNGFSLVRKVLEHAKLDPASTTPFSKESWKECLLRPTHLYVKPLLESVSEIHALAHITGGGLFENLPRVLPTRTQARVDSKLWKFPPLFAWLAEQANLPTEKMLSTFNCGVGMIAVIPSHFEVTLIDRLKRAGLAAWRIGDVAESPDEKPSVVWR